jgi:PKD repeat protein
MKRSLLLCFFLLFGLYAAFAQGTLTTATPNPIPTNYTGTLTITGTGTQFQRATAGINLKLTHVGSGQIYSFGTAPGGAGWIAGNPAPNATMITGNISIPANAPTGFYNVELRGFSGDNFMQNMFVNANSFINIGGSIGYFAGKVVMESDSNCVYGGADYGVPNALVTATPGPYYGITDGQGNFQIPLPLGTYTFSTPAPAGGTMICPASPFTLNATVSTLGATTSGINFFSKPNHITDLSTNLVLGNHRPGFTNNQVNVFFQNMTPTPAANVVLKLLKPSTFSYGSVPVGPPASINGDTMIWNLGVIGPNASFQSYLYTTVPVGTPLGTPFSYTSTVTTSSIETVTANNTDVKTGNVMGSYDPNDKRVWTSTGQVADPFIVATDTMLRYMIRFQNTGTDTAFNITIRDTFDTDFNMSTLRILGASHPFVTQFTDSTGRRARFVFANILLLDSFANEPLSHGWIEYTIRKNNGLPTGTVLKNRASIYFDFNAPIVTNWASSTICPNLGTAFTVTSNALTATMNGPTTGGATTWAWNFGDGQTGNGANPVHVYAAAGTYNVCVTVTNACGRSKQICQSVTVNCAPMQAGFSANPGAGLTINFTNTSTGATGYAWTFGDGGTSTLASPPHTYPTPGLYTACLITTNVCGTRDTSCVAIAVGCAAATASFSASNAAWVYNFSNQSQGTNLTYAWDFGDGGTSTFPSPIHPFQNIGSFQVCLTVTDACQQTATTCSTIVVLCAQIQSAFFSAPINGTVTFTDQSTNSPNTWTWDFGDGGTSALASPVHTYAASGTYQACLTAANDCSTDSTCAAINVVVVGINPTELPSIQLAPNPASDQVQLRMAEAQLQDVRFRLMDALGRLVAQWQETAINGDYVHPLDLTAQAEGVYFLRIDAPGLQHTLRLVVQR